DGARAFAAAVDTVVLVLLVPAAYALPGLVLLRTRFPRWVTVHMALLGLTGFGAAAASDLTADLPFAGPAGWGLTAVTATANLVLVAGKWRRHRAVVFAVHRAMWAITDR